MTADDHPDCPGCHGLGETELGDCRDCDGSGLDPLWCVPSSAPSRTVVGAHEVVDGMLVRDSSGDYLLRYGPFAHIAQANGVREQWRSWAPPLMRWPKIGRFEVAASGLARDASADELRAAAERFERHASKVTDWDPMAVVAEATEQHGRDRRPGVLVAGVRDV